jgi:hypothetical protein
VIAMTEAEILQTAIHQIESGRLDEAGRTLRHSSHPRAKASANDCERLAKEPNELLRSMLLKALKGQLDALPPVPHDGAKPGAGASFKVVCPNPQCRAALKLTGPVAPGKKLQCPRCGASFRASAPTGVGEPKAASANASSSRPAPAAKADDEYHLAPEPERKCPSCQAALAQGAVLCTACGLDLRTGEKVKGPKKAPQRKAKADKDEIDPDEIPELLNDADKLIALAEEEVDEPLPILAGITSDLATFALRANSKILQGRCANPNCKASLAPDEIDEYEAQQAGMFVNVSYTFAGKKLKMALCWECSEQFKLEMGSRVVAVKTLLEQPYEELRQASRQHPQDDRLKKRIKKMEELADRVGLTLSKGGMCFIATAAYGSPWAEEVETLRRFRDAALLPSAAGRLAVRIYYAVSPPLAALLRKSRWGRWAVRGALGPMVQHCRRRLG